MGCIVQGVAKSWTRLSDFHFHFHNFNVLIITCILLIYLFFWLRQVAFRILVLQAGIEPAPSAVKSWSHNCWAGRKLLYILFRNVAFQLTE